MKEKNTLTIKNSHTISLENIGDLLTSAFEGGSNYWYMIEKALEPTKWEFEDKQLGRPDKNNPKSHWLFEYPLNPGGALLISNEVGLDRGEKKRTEKLNLVSIEHGLYLMANEYKKHFYDFLEDNADADTGDIFLQLCLFGEVIYG